jgi:hypothetical protein
MKALIDAGLIELRDIKPLALEKRREEKKEPASKKPKAPSRRRADSASRLPEVIEPRASAAAYSNGAPDDLPDSTVDAEMLDLARSTLQRWKSPKRLPTVDPTDNDNPFL